MLENMLVGLECHLDVSAIPTMSWCLQRSVIHQMGSTHGCVRHGAYLLFKRKRRTRSSLKGNLSFHASKYWRLQSPGRGKYHCLNAVKVQLRVLLRCRINYRWLAIDFIHG